MKKCTLLILIAFVVLGCLAESPEFASSTQTPAIPTTLTPSEIPAITPSQTTVISVPTLTPTPEFQFGVKYPAKVIYVYDGDTIKANLSGQILIIRLLGVDTPEKSAEKNKPYEYDAITNLTYLAEWGLKARDFAYAMLYNKTVYIEFDEVAGLKGYYGRYLAYVYVNGTDFNALLVKNGLLEFTLKMNLRRSSITYSSKKLQDRTRRVCGELDEVIGWTTCPSSSVCSYSLL